MTSREALKSVLFSIYFQFAKKHKPIDWAESGYKSFSVSLFKQQIAKVPENRI